MTCKRWTISKLLIALFCVSVFPQLSSSKLHGQQPSGSPEVVQAQRMLTPLFRSPLVAPGTLTTGAHSTLIVDSPPQQVVKTVAELPVYQDSARTISPNEPPPMRSVVGGSFQDSGKLQSDSNEIPTSVLSDDVESSLSGLSALQSNEPDDIQLELGQTLELTNNSDGFESCSGERVWFSTIDVTFLRPNGAKPEIGNFSGSVVTQASFRDLENFYSAPRLTLGTQKGNHGFQVRYFHLRFGEDEFSNPFENSPPVSSLAFSESSLNLDMMSIDAELTRNYNWRDIDGDLIFGTRYVNYESRARAQSTDLIGGEIGTVTSLADRNYEGMGFVLGFSGARAMRGKFGQQGWKWFWQGRTSGVFGTNFHRQLGAIGFDGDHLTVEAQVRNSQTMERVEANGNAQGEARAIADDDNTLWIFEGQLGVECERPIEAISGYAFFRLGVEYQYWDFPQSEADIRGRVGSPVVPDFQPVSTSGFGLTGVVVSTGIRY